MPLYANFLSSSAQTISTTEELPRGAVQLQLQSASPIEDLVLTENGATITLNRGGTYAIGYGVIVDTGAEPAADTSIMVLLNGEDAIDYFTITDNMVPSTKQFTAALPAGSRLQLVLSARGRHVFTLPALTNGNAYVTLHRVGELPYSVQPRESQESNF